jgi:hypothetical protein
MTAPAKFRFSAEVRRINTFFYTYDFDAPDPVIAGVTFGNGGEVTVFSRAQAQEIADAFLGLVAQFAELEAREGESR